MRKLMWFSIGFSVAAIFSTYLLPPSFYMAEAAIAAVALAVSLIGMLRFRVMRFPAMVMFAAALGFVWITGFHMLFLSPIRACDNITANITVTAVDYSYATDYGASVEGRVDLNGKTYKVLTYLDANITLKPGDMVSGTFLLRCTLPGGTHESAKNRSEGFFLTARPRGKLTETSCEKIPWKYYPAEFRRQILEKIQSIFPGDTVGFTQALLLGNTDEIDYETDTAFKLSGIRHIIAVSGLHVTILFSLVYMVTGRKKWITALLGIPVLVLFAAIVGFSPSITRACIMHSLMVIAMLFNKEYDPPTALSFAVLCMLLINPWTVTSVGFQLSVCCMIGIFLFSDHIRNYLMDKKRLGRLQGKWKKLAGGFSASVGVSLSAAIVTTPLCAYYFGVVSLIAPLTNLLCLWVISIIFYGILLSCAMGAIIPLMGSTVAWLVSWPIRYVIQMAKALAVFPLSAVYTKSVYIVVWLVFVYLLLTVFLLSKKKYPLQLTCFATIGLCVALFVSWTEPKRDDFRMTVLDVGQGQCILLQSAGKNYLVDCGSYSDTFAADQAASFLLSQGISRLDGIILTHYDADHAGGVPNLLTRVSADCLFLPNCLDADDSGSSLYSNSDGRVFKVGSDTEIIFDDTVITLVPLETGVSKNESGLCILFQTKTCDILITGDCSAAGERELIRHMTLPELEVLIVGHHGSKTSTSRELLIKTSPEIAIISVGADNSYGHPTDEVLRRLEQYGCRIYRTDLNGTIVYRG